MKTQNDLFSVNKNLFYWHYFKFNDGYAYTLDRQPSKALLKIDERGSKIDRNSVFDCHLSPIGRQMVIENSETILDLRLQPILCGQGCHFQHRKGFFFCLSISTAVTILEWAFTVNPVPIAHPKRYFRPSFSYFLPIRPLFCLFLSGRLRQVLLYLVGAQLLIGRVLDSRLRGRGFEPHRCHCVVVLEQDTFILA